MILLAYPTAFLIIMGLGLVAVIAHPLLICLSQARRRKRLEHRTTSMESYLDAIRPLSEREETIFSAVILSVARAVGVDRSQLRSTDILSDTLRLNIVIIDDSFDGWCDFLVELLPDDCSFESKIAVWDLSLIDVAKHIARRHHGVAV